MTVLKSQAIEPAFLQHRNSCIPGVGILLLQAAAIPVAHKRTRVRVRCIICHGYMHVLWLLIIHYRNFIVIHIIMYNINYHYCASVCVRVLV